MSKIVSKVDIERDLKKLDKLYEAEADAYIQLCFSKLAIIELSSWVELSFDLIIKRTIKKCLLPPSYLELLEDTIKNNHGFKYDRNFIATLSKVAGYKSCVSLEENLINSGMRDRLKSELGTLSKQRNTAAHVGARHARSDAPNSTLRRFYRLYPILKEMNSWAIRYCP